MPILLGFSATHCLKFPPLRRLTRTTIFTTRNDTRSKKKLNSRQQIAIYRYRLFDCSIPARCIKAVITTNHQIGFTFWLEPLTHVCNWRDDIRLHLPRSAALSRTKRCRRRQIYSEARLANLVIRLLLAHTSNASK